MATDRGSIKSASTPTRAKIRWRKERMGKRKTSEKERSKVSKVKNQIRGR